MSHHALDALTHILATYLHSTKIIVPIISMVCVPTWLEAFTGKLTLEDQHATVLVKDYKACIIFTKYPHNFPS